MLLSKEGEMSSLRVAIGSGLLVVALGAGTWGAANAFPLYTEQVAQPQAPPRDPKTPPRDRVPALTYHRQAVELWDKSRDASLTPEQRLELARQGIALEDKALAINPDYVDALTYKNIFLRIEANLTPEAARQRELLDQANALRTRAIQIRKTQPYVPQSGEPAPPPPPPPPPPPMVVTASDGSTSVVVPSPAAPMVAPTAAYTAALAAHDPLRIGGEIKSPAKIRDVKPVYPAEARGAGVQGVVIVEILVDPAGDVVDARVLRSIPILDEAALNAVRQWRFTPTLLNGEPRSVLLTVTVSFRIQ
jgi:TonB family protein